MVGFQILNKKGTPIEFSIINQEVAQIWGKQYNTYIGTRPYPSLNTEFSSLFEGEVWADKLLNICKKYGSKNWNDLHIDLITELTNKAGKDDEILHTSITYNEPYIRLIDELSYKYEFKFIDETLEDTL